tara:strand:- start:1905 stop:2387 length:483 start_codon:yes stop_codon:yes gene_type:complete
MQFYETLYIVDSNLENKSLEKTMTDIGKKLEKTKSKIINHRIWGKKRLAYPIHRQKYGSYVIMQYEAGDLSKMVDYETWLKLNNAVLRHMTVALNEKPEVYIEKENPDSNNKEIESSSDIQKENADSTSNDDNKKVSKTSKGDKHENKLKTEEDSEKEEV